MQEPCACMNMGSDHVADKTLLEYYNSSSCKGCACCVRSCEWCENRALVVNTLFNGCIGCGNSMFGTIWKWLLRYIIYVDGDFNEFWRCVVCMGWHACSLWFYFVLQDTTAFKKENYARFGRVRFMKLCSWAAKAIVVLLLLLWWYYCV